MKQRYFLVGLIVLTMALAWSCAGPPPSSIALQYLEAMKRGKWDEAVKLVDTGKVFPPSLSGLQGQQGSTEGTTERFGKLLLSKMSYDIGETRTEDQSATVKAKIKSVEMKGIVAKYISENLVLALAAGFPGNKLGAPDFQKYLEDAIDSPQAPMVTTDVNIKLVRFQDQWRVSIDDNLTNAMTGNLADLAKAFQSSSPTPQPTSPATPTPTPTARPIPTVTPTPAVGFARSNPAPLGMPVRSVYKERDVERVTTITIKETIRGEEAWKRIKAANMFNRPPETGNEFILARVYFKYETGPAEVALSVGESLFKAISAQGKEYGLSWSVLPEPRLESKLYPGASNEGWVCFLVALDDHAPLAAYGRSYDGSSGVWFQLQ